MEIAERKRTVWRSPQYQNQISRVIMNRRIKFIAVLAMALGFAWSALPAQPKVGADARRSRAALGMREFMEANCFACHDAKSKKGNLDLTSLKFDATDAKTFDQWVKVHDRVRDK